MNNADMKNGPHFEMWVIGVAAGLVAAAVMYLVGKYGFMASAFVGALVALIVAAVFGLPAAKREPLPDADEAADEGATLAGADTVHARAALAESAATASMPEAMQPAVAAPAAPQAAAFAAMPVDAAPAAAAKASGSAPAKAAAAPKAAVATTEDGPARLKAARKGGADDLKEIEGIGPAMEKLVNELGFYHFDQIAGWSDADVAWVDANMKTFKGRIVRDKWVAQAKIIVAEGLDAFRIRAKTNDY